MNKATPVVQEVTPVQSFVHTLLSSSVVTDCIRAGTNPDPEDVHTRMLLDTLCINCMHILYLAGFENSTIKNFNLRLHDTKVMRCGGSRNTGNHLYPMFFGTVVNEIDAHRWLNALFHYVLLDRHDAPHDDVITEIETLITAAHKIAPITINTRGEELSVGIKASLMNLPHLQNSSAHRYYRNIFVQHYRDDDTIRCDPSGRTPLVHLHCGDGIERHNVTGTSDVLCCPRCHLRVHIPRSTATFGAVRAEMQGQIETQQRYDADIRHVIRRNTPTGGHQPFL